MGVLRELAGSAAWALRTLNTIGRAPQANVKLEDSAVSSLHASLRWIDGGWELRDLGSRNGTFVNGMRLEAGKRRRLQAGDELWFGSREHTCELSEASGPSPMVVSDDGEVLTASGPLLVVPNPQNPLVSFFPSVAGAWHMESVEGCVPVTNGHRFEVAGRGWMLNLPDDVPRTASTAEADVREARLVFAVSADEEHVELTLESRAGTLALGRRASNYLLLTLARRRLEDGALGHPAPECGWIEAQDLAKGLKTTPEHINLDIFRVRKRLGEHFANPGEIVERRSGQLRLGVSEIRIEQVRPG